MSVPVPHQIEAEIFQPPTSSSISPLCIMTLMGVAAPPQEATLTPHRPEDSPQTSKFITPAHHKGPTVYMTQPHRTAVCLVPQSHGSKGTSFPHGMIYDARNKLTRLLWQDGNPRFQGPMKWPESLHYLCCGSATSDACYKYPLFAPNLDTRQLHDVAVENDVEWNRLI